MQRIDTQRYHRPKRWRSVLMAGRIITFRTRNSSDPSHHISYHTVRSELRVFTHTRDNLYWILSKWLFFRCTTTAAAVVSCKSFAISSHMMRRRVHFPVPPFEESRNISCPDRVQRVVWQQQQQETRSQMTKSPNDGDFRISKSGCCVQKCKKIAERRFGRRSESQLESATGN